MTDSTPPSDDRAATLILFVAGDSPRSRRARERLRKSLAAHGRDPDGYREIDLLKHPESIIEHRVFAAPTLLHCTPGGEPETLYGDLADSGQLSRILG